MQRKHTNCEHWWCMESSMKSCFLAWSSKEYYHSTHQLTCKINLCTLPPLLHFKTLKLYTCVVLDKLAVLPIVGAFLSPSFSAIATASSSESFPAYKCNRFFCAHHTHTRVLTFTSASNSAFLSSSLGVYKKKMTGEFVAREVRNLMQSGPGVIKCPLRRRVCILFIVYTNTQSQLFTELLH